MDSKNKRFWDVVCHVPEKATKAFSNGRFSGTDIKPIWRIEILTDVFGPAGFGWYTDNIKYWIESSATEAKAFCTLDLHVKDPETGEWSAPIHGIGGNTFIENGKSGQRADDECYKKAYSDAISVACRSLGVGADIYAGNPALDNSKYQQWYNGGNPQTTEPKKTDDDLAKKIEEAKAKISKAVTTEEVKNIYGSFPDDFKKIPEFRDFVIEYGKKLAS